MKASSNLILFLITLLYSFRGGADVTVFWEQDGSDVTASWFGTIDFSASPLVDTTVTLDNIQSVDPNRLFVTNSPFGKRYYSEVAGSATTLNVINTVSSVVINDTESFGFAFDFIAWNDVHITGGSLGSVTELTFDPSRDVIRFEGQTLAGLGVDSSSDTVAWTATGSGDTISYTTGPVIPEPSSIIMVCITAITGFLFMRRRQRHFYGSK